MTSLSPNVKNFDASEYLAAYQNKRVRRPIYLNFNENTCPLEADCQESVLSSGFRAFARLALQMKVKDFLALGTGNGLDALGAIEIFDLDSVTITDVLPEIVAAARENIELNLEPGTKVKIYDYVGSLLSCIPAEQKFSLIYENLPVLQKPQDVDLKEGINSTIFFDREQEEVPEILDSYLLGSHYLCLQQAYERLYPGGGVITGISGRVPLEIVFNLHQTCGYTPELIVFDVKIQSAPETILPGYSQVEEEKNIEFKYYATEAIAIVEAARSEGLEGQEILNAVQSDIDRYAMSAKEAWHQVGKGKKIAQGEWMVFGKR
ncbi:MAG: hypothetical protein AB4352_20295 [Hormoscilla sp.]